MSSIFLSHSSKDNGIAGQVKTRLEQLGHRSVFLDFDPAELQRVVFRPAHRALRADVHGA